MNETTLRFEDVLSAYKMEIGELIAGLTEKLAVSRATVAALKTELALARAQLSDSSDNAIERAEASEDRL